MVRPRQPETRMRRTVSPFLALALLLPAGCARYAGNPGAGFGGFIAETHSVRRDPNQPKGDSETIKRVLGRAQEITPLSTEPGNVWPGPLEPEKTIADLQREQNNTPIGVPTPGSPITQGGVLQGDTPRRPRGSSETPPSNQPGLRPLPPLPEVPAVTPKPATPRSMVFQTPQGPISAMESGTGSFTYQPAAGGGVGTIVPNGNGTATLISPEGNVSTVQMPR